MDPLESIQFHHDTTYALIVESVARGHDAFHVSPDGVGYGPDGATLRGRRVRPTGDPADPFEIGSFEARTGTDLDAVLVRTDPPFDEDYLNVTQLLDLLRPRKFVMNRPAGLRDANEKLAALHFPDLGPSTTVASDPARLDAFRREVGGSIVLKPLHGHGGEGVLLIREGDPNRAALLRAATAGGRTKAMAQAVAPGAEVGDRRLILLDGEPLGAVLRRNDRGGFAHNLAAGGTAHASAVTEEDRSLCRRLAPWLRVRGLWLAGIDLVGGLLIEINVTSPTCVREINRFDGVALERPILDFVERMVGSSPSTW